MRMNYHFKALAQNLLLAIIFSSAYSQTHKWSLETSDTKLDIGIDENKLILYRLTDASSGDNWLDRPSVFPMMTSVIADGSPHQIYWVFKNSLAQGKDTLNLFFEDSNSSLKLLSRWITGKGPGPVRHCMYLSNNSDRQLTITHQPSIDLVIKSSKYPVRVTYINDDASYPDSVGVYHKFISGNFRQDWKISEKQDWISILFIDKDNSHGIYGGLEWSSGLMKLTSDNRGCNMSLGLEPTFKTNLSPHEIFQVPTGFIGAYSGDLDAAGNSIRSFLFNHSMPSVITYDSTFPKVEWNAFAATGKHQGSWDPVESKYYPFIDDIAPLGFEEVVLDIGWWKSHGDPGHIIEDSIDWPSGILAAATYAKQKGMRFGLYDNESEDLTSEAGKAERFNDIKYQFEKLGSEIYRSDATAGPVTVNAIGEGSRSNFPEDTTYWSVKGFYEVIDSLYKTVKGFTWENCAIGGGLKDFGALKRASKVQNLDVYYPLEARKAFYDASFALHPIQIASLTGSWSDWQANGSVYEFRSASMGAANWHPDAPNGSNGGPIWSNDHKKAIAKAVNTYKTKLRPLIRKANLYHIFPRPNGVFRDGIQYYDPSTGKGAIYIFQSVNITESQLVKLKGLNPNSRYLVEFEDGTASPSIIKGKKLLNKGLRVWLKGDQSSEIIHLSQIKNR